MTVCILYKKCRKILKSLAFEPLGKECNRKITLMLLRTGPILSKAHRPRTALRLIC